MNVENVIKKKGRFPTLGMLNNEKPMKAEYDIINKNDSWEWKVGKQQESLDWLIK